VAIAASWPISAKVGAIAVRRMSPASWNSSPRARKRPRPNRTAVNPAAERERMATLTKRPKAIAAPVKMTTAPATSTSRTSASTTSRTTPSGRNPSMPGPLPIAARREPRPGVTGVG
jgi:hypothetical protein